MIYRSLLGYDCITTSNTIIHYPKKLLELFSDPISFEELKEPIIMVDYPENIYDKSSLIAWLCQSNVEPMLNIKFKTKQIKFRKILNYHMALLLLEEKDDGLLFHIPNIDLIHLLILTNIIVERNNQADFSHKNNDGKDIYLDLSYYENCKIDMGNGLILHNEGKTKYIEEYGDYDLHDILIRDVFTRKKIINPVVNENGLYFDLETLTTINNYSSIFVHVNKYSAEQLNNSILLTKIYDFFKMHSIDESPNKSQRSYDIFDWTKNKDEKYIKMYDWFNYFFKKKAPLEFDLRKNDFYLSCSSTSENMLTKLKEIKKSKEKYKNFSSRRRYLSECVRENPDLLMKPVYGGNAPMTKLKLDLGFPVLGSLDSTYEDDFSMLDLSNISFFSSSDAYTDLKGRDFIGTNFNNSKFKNIHFSVCSFVGAKMRNVIFENCVFKECKFLNADLDGYELINTTGDSDSFESFLATS